MGAFHRLLWRSMETKRLAAARLRTHYFRLLGAHIGAKCLFGRSVRIDRPWTVSMGSRCMLEPDVWFDIVDDRAEVRLGNHVFMGRGVHLLLSDGLTIGDHSLIGDGVIIADHKHNIAADRLIETQGCNSTRISIGSDVLVCVRAMILQGVKIGDGAVVGPGAIVSHDVAPYSIVGMPPARVLGVRQ